MELREREREREAEREKETETERPREIDEPFCTCTVYWSIISY